MTAWGFRYSTIAFVWIKTLRSLEPGPRLISSDEIESTLCFGTGYTTRAQCELVLLGRRGKPKRLAKDVRQAIIAPAREYGRKPDEFFVRVERLYRGPYLELFAREHRPGWTAWGDETGKFDLPCLGVGPQAERRLAYAGG